MQQGFAIIPYKTQVSPINLVLHRLNDPKRFNSYVYLSHTCRERLSSFKSGTNVSYDREIKGLEVVLLKMELE